MNYDDRLINKIDLSYTMPLNLRTWCLVMSPACLMNAFTLGDFRTNVVVWK